MITAELVKQLREKTGAGMMDCKKVLTETDGDMEKAIELLRERGITKAAKKTDRIAAEGIVAAYVAEDGKVGSVVEVNSETDFVGKNEEFRSFVADVAEQIAKENPANVEELLNQKSMKDSTKTVQEVLTGKIATIGENITIRRFERFEANGLVEKYIHGDGKIGVLVDAMGRVNYGEHMTDRKGITDIYIGNQRQMGYDVYTIPLDNLDKLEYKADKKEVPLFLKGSFKAESNKDCFVHLNGFKKGYVWVNGFNLGRYWEIGPQKSLYLPGALLKEENEIIVLEMEGFSNPTVSITDKHNLG